MHGHHEVKERVLVVDDNEDCLAELGRILRSAGYRCTTVNDASEARTCLESTPFDLMLCEVRLGGAGLDLAKRALTRHPGLATVMVSGLEDVELADRALSMGAHGYLVKPFSVNDVMRSVLSAASRRRYDLDAEAEANLGREEMIHRLCITVEARDPAAAAHINQMSEYCSEIAAELGLPAARCGLIRLASAMHDIGKVGIPERILLKPGSLTADEREIVQRHAEIGYRILAGSRSELLQLAAQIAWTHHEHFDGGGYPRGIGGFAIPLEGRIAAVADVFDALTRDRVYRPRFSRSEALAMLEDGRGRHFDPQVLDALVAILERAQTRTPVVHSV
ncbi:MAG TPA: HD domain-containing phosphohydrolase [Conexibacter sp.]|nr:HD domain-containing phosphohydrolase [Conexibacter sp.]